MELRDFVRKKLNLKPEDYYWDEWQSALDHMDQMGLSEYTQEVWDARQPEIDELKERNKFLEKTLQEMMV